MVGPLGTVHYVVDGAQEEGCRISIHFEFPFKKGKNYLIASVAGQRREEMPPGFGEVQITLWEQLLQITTAHTRQMLFTFHSD